ncbi:MAG: enoyl-CoA hydratase/isomerase family protein [Alphaproteobacteria bacterium]|nr:enoyl-CoA hydratase/isomerase family protein [Alphaproteobacteria bacterium]
MTSETISLEVDRGVAVLTLRRPERLNAMNKQMLGEMLAACDRVEDDDAVRALVLTGEGKAFSAGFDLQDQAADPPQGRDQWGPVLRKDFDAVMRFWHLAKPTIAAVRGPALAGGCELALACDVTVAAADARFGEPELKFGAGIVVMLMPWLVGPKKAKEVLLLGLDDISAEEALALGMINRVVPVGEELPTALHIARQMAVIDPAVVRRTKAAINDTMRIMGMDQALEAALAADVDLEGKGSDDKRQFLAKLREGGLRAALAWRDARFDV